MAGEGSRFAKEGYTFPKPLIDVHGKPMIQVVVENLNIEANYIFIVQKEHYEKYNLQYLLNLIAPNCNIVQVDGITEGAACTTLLAKSYIDNNEPLIIANSDQFVEWNSDEFIYACSASDLDANILTFTSTHPKWSYAKINEFGYVTEVAEKKPISGFGEKKLLSLKKNPKSDNPKEPTIAYILATLDASKVTSLLPVNDINTKRVAPRRGNGATAN